MKKTKLTILNKIQLKKEQSKLNKWADKNQKNLTQ